LWHEDAVSQYGARRQGKTRKDKALRVDERSSFASHSREGTKQFCLFPDGFTLFAGEAILRNRQNFSPFGRGAVLRGFTPGGNGIASGRL
jgi:hypothetical protein